MSGGAANAAFLLAVGIETKLIPLPDMGVTLFTTPLVLAGIPGTASGATSLSLGIPNNANLHNFQVTLQVFHVAQANSRASNALVMQICK